MDARGDDLSPVGDVGGEPEAGERLRGGEVGAILVPWLINGWLISFSSSSTVWAWSFALGAVPVAVATLRLRRRRKRAARPVNGLEGLGWTYLVIFAVAVCLFVPAMIWAGGS